MIDIAQCSPSRKLTSSLLFPLVQAACSGVSDQMFSHLRMSGGEAASKIRAASVLPL